MVCGFMAVFNSGVSVHKIKDDQEPMQSNVTSNVKVMQTIKKA